MQYNQVGRKAREWSPCALRVFLVGSRDWSGTWGSEEGSAQSPPMPGALVTLLKIMR